MNPFAVSLYQAVGGLFLFLVCCTLYASRRRPYFQYWTLAWLCFNGWLLLSSLARQWLALFPDSADWRGEMGTAAAVLGWWHPGLWLIGMLYFWQGRGLGKWQVVLLGGLAAIAFLFRWAGVPVPVENTLLTIAIAAAWAWSSVLLGLSYPRQVRLGPCILAVVLAANAFEQVYSAVHSYGNRTSPDRPTSFRDLAFVEFLLQNVTAVGMIIVLLEEEQVALQGALSGRKRTEAELHRAKNAAEAASRAKSDFLANVSHEIRTPMNAIVGMTEMALATDMTAEQRDYLEVVKVAADSLLAVINDVLDLSKIEARKLQLYLTAFCLREDLSTTVKMLSLRARQKGLELTWRVRDDVPDWLVGDPERLRQVVINLLGNAVKFTEQGRVSVEVEPAADLGGDVLLHFAFTDTGIGIAREKLESIFRPFEQSDGSTTRRYGGTGLGLSISAHLAGLMGGRVWVESEPGKGSTFHFTAQFTKTGASAAPPTKGREEGNGRTAGDGVAPLRVLLAEDNEFNQRPVIHMLEKHGHKVVVAANGKEALAALAAQDFDLVLMDVQMPEMDGFEAARAVRAREAGTGRHVPILALTAHVLDEDRQRCLRAGMDGYLAKPVLARDLWRAVEEVVPRVAPAAAGGAPAARPDGALDQQAMLARVDNNTRLLQEVVVLFLKDCPRLLSEARTAVDGRDGPRLARAAHTLKGSTSFFCAEPAAGAARRLEVVGREENWGQAEGAYAELCAEVGRLRISLAALGEGDAP